MNSRVVLMNTNKIMKDLDNCYKLRVSWWARTEAVAYFKILKRHLNP